MNDNRLESIKEKTSFAGDMIDYLEKEDYEWLIEQAERVVELENQLETCVAFDLNIPPIPPKRTFKL